MVAFAEADDAHEEKMFSRSGADRAAVAILVRLPPEPGPKGRAEAMLKLRPLSCPVRCDDAELVRLANLVLHDSVESTDGAAAVTCHLVVIVVSPETAHSCPMPQETAAKQHLTHREQEILAQLAGGRTAASIGRRLGIARGTVCKHLEHIYAKLGHHDRLSAVTYARETGLLG